LLPSFIGSRLIEAQRHGRGAVGRAGAIVPVLEQDEALAGVLARSALATARDDEHRADVVAFGLLDQVLRLAATAWVCSIVEPTGRV
jgi:hypothetical protein